MGPASGHSGTGCSPKSLRALAPRLTRHRAGLRGDLLLSPAVWMSWSPVSLACLCLNDAEGAVGWTAFLSLSGAKETLSVLTMNFPTRLCKGSVLFSQSCWLRF